MPPTRPARRRPGRRSRPTSSTSTADPRWSSRSTPEYASGARSPRPTATPSPPRPAWPCRSGCPSSSSSRRAAPTSRDGVAALTGWGTAAREHRALLRRRAGHPRRDRSGRVGPGPAARPGRRRDHDARRLRLRVAGPGWSRPSPACRSRPSPSAAPAPTPGPAGSPALIAADDADARRAGRRAAVAPAVEHSTRSRPASTPTTPSTGPTPEAGDLMPATATGSYDVRAVIRAIVDDGELLELRAGVGRQPRHRARHASAADPSASWPTSPRRWPARSTSPRRRRAPGSWRSATRSTSRCSPSSTRPASPPARTRSGGA